MVKIINEDCKDYGLKLGMYRKTTNLFGTIWVASVSDDSDDFVREFDVPSDVQTKEEVIEWAKEFTEDWGEHGQQRCEIHFLDPTTQKKPRA